MIKWLLCLLSLLLVVKTFAQGELRPTDTLPVFESVHQQNQVFTVDSVLPRPLIIIIWATWNPQSVLLLEELKQQWSFINPVRRGVLQMNMDVVDFAMDTRKEPHMAFLKREELPWATHLSDYKGWESEVVNQLRISKIPSMIIIDENRRILVVDPDIKQIRNVLSNIKVNRSLSN